MYHISVQFSGTPKEYAYTCPTEPALGQRVVVPTSMKKDGTVALSIATIVAFGLAAESIPSAKPIIALLDSSLIAAARAFVLKLEVLAT